MQWSTPRPGNPWPQEMVITVDDHPLSLNLLLFVRHAWSLVSDADIPRLTPAPDPGASQAPDTASLSEWNERWRIAWNRAWAWYTIQDEDRTKHPTQEILREVFQPGQELHPLVPPLWTVEYDWDGLDQAAFNSWDRSLSPLTPTDEERKNLQDLIPAWESGLDTVIVLPYDGYFARRITRRHLAVSAATRNDPATYSRALREAAL
jgi:hypothetical protein